MALSSGPATLDPRYATDAVGERIDELIFDTLIRIGPDLRPLPRAAEKWQLDGHTYTFYLRPGLRFHNGRPLTREDVEFSLDAYRGARSPFASNFDFIKAVRVTEKAGQILLNIEVKTVSDKLLNGYLKFIKLLPKAETLEAGADFTNHLIGTGGYRFVRQDANEIELESVTAKTKHLIFKIIRDDFTRYQKLLKGEVDIAQMEITPDRVADFQKRPDEFQVFLYPGLNMTYMLVNFRDPWLAKMPAREALSLALNRPEIIRYKLYGQAREATSLLTPQNPYFAQGLQAPAYDLSAAKKFLSEAGPPPSEIVLKTSNTPQAVDNGKVLAYQMSQAGVQVKVRSYEWGTFYSDIKHGNFQLATMKWVSVLDPDIYKLAFHSTEKPPGRNRGSYSNPEVDRLLDQGTDEPDISKRKAVFDRVQKLILDDLAVIPLWYDEQVAIARKNVMDYHPDSSGDYWSLFQVYKRR